MVEERLRSKFGFFRLSPSIGFACQPKSTAVLVITEVFEFWAHRVESTEVMASSSVWSPVPSSAPLRLGGTPFITTRGCSLRFIVRLKAFVAANYLVYLLFLLR